MEQQYLVSARKYRPTTFDSVVGQEALTSTLKNAIRSGKLAHAYLFCGPRGVGKTTCARIFAKNINCLNPVDGEACGKCESCLAFDEGRSMNIYELDAASNNSVDDIRSITEQVHIPPQIGKYKVYIIDEVHMLSPAAFNAFLKTLEEPPHYVVFILATTEKHKLLPTILSRCQIYDFNRMEAENIVNHLKSVAERENITYEDEALSVIARKADGGMRDALSIFDQVASYCRGNITYKGAIENLNILDYEYYFKVTDLIIEKKIPDLLVMLDGIVRKGFDPGLFIAGLAEHLRDLLVSRDSVTLPLLEVTDAIRSRYYEQSQKIKPAFIYSAMRICNECSLNYKNSRNKKLQVELALIMTAQLDENGEGPSSGRRPKKLRPLFVANVQQSAAQRADVAPRRVENEVKESVTVTNDVKPKAADPNRNTRAAVSFSIKSFLAKGSSTEDQSVKVQDPHPVETVDEELQHLPNKKIDESELAIEWRVFAQLMPKEDAALSKRMFNMELKLIEPEKFEVVVDSELVKNMINEKRGVILKHLRKVMQNGNLDMTLRVLEKEFARVPVSPVEKYRELVSINKDLEDLVKEMNLEIY